MGQFDIISTVSFLSRCLWQHKMSKTNMFHALVRVSLWSQRGTGAPPSFFCWVPRHILGRCQFGADHLGTTLCSKEISKETERLSTPKVYEVTSFYPLAGENLPCNTDLRWEEPATPEHCSSFLCLFGVLDAVLIRAQARSCNTRSASGPKWCPVWSTAQNDPGTMRKTMENMKNTGNYFTSSDPRPDTLFWHGFWHTIWKYNIYIYIYMYICIYVYMYICIYVYVYIHTHSDILSDILSGLLSGIYSDILSSILFDIYSDILSGILSDILSGILSSIFWGIHSGLLSGIYSDILSSILFGIYSDFLSGILSDFLSGILSSIFSGIHSGLLSGIYSDILSSILFDIYSDILFGILSGILAFSLTWVRVQAPSTASWARYIEIRSPSHQELAEGEGREEAEIRTRASSAEQTASGRPENTFDEYFNYCRNQASFTANEPCLMRCTGFHIWGACWNWGSRACANGKVATTWQRFDQSIFLRYLALIIVQLTLQCFWPFVKLC